MDEDFGKVISIIPLQAGDELHALQSQKVERALSFQAELIGGSVERW